MASDPPLKAKPLLITIDGPAGAGKTTISKRLAQRLGYRYLDTGALYRGVAKAAADEGISPDDDQALSGLCGRIRLVLVNSAAGWRLILNQTDITDEIRTPAISMLASAVSARPVVRAFLMQTQQDIGHAKRVVAEGRDMGTVVFPDADVKFFLHADHGERAHRRYAELRASGTSSLTLQAVEKEMRKRDHDDATRAVAPLQAAGDAIVIDSTHLSIDQVVDAMLGHIGPKLYRG